jgi:hypothetical protein
MLSRRTWTICAGLAAVVIVAAGVSGAADKPVLDILKEKAGCIRETCNGQLLTLTMLTHAGPQSPDQAGITKEFTILWLDDTLYMRSVWTYEKKPAYTPPEKRPYSGIDYVADKELIVWRTPEEYMLASPTRNESVEVVKAFHVKPDGSVKEGGESRMKTIHPAGSSGGAMEYYWFEMTMGRAGLQRLRKAFVTEKDSSTGMTHMVAEGAFGAGPSGEWNMQIDSSCDYLVRQAVMRRDPNHTPMVTTECSGTIEVDGRTVCASSGSLTLGSETIVLTEGRYQNVKVRKVSDAEREGFRQTVLDQVNGECQRTDDLRGETPVVTHGSSSCGP